jgi:uncharacterized membrane protein
MKGIKLFGVLGFLLLVVGDVVPVVSYALFGIGAILVLFLMYEISIEYFEDSLFSKTLLALVLQFVAPFLIAFGVVAIFRSSGLSIGGLYVYSLGFIFLALAGNMWKNVFLTLYKIFSIELFRVAAALVFVGYTVTSIINLFLCLLLVFSVNGIFFTMVMLISVIFVLGKLISKAGFIVGSVSFYLIDDHPRVEGTAQGAAQC